MYLRTCGCTLLLAAVIASASIFPKTADATIVEFQTVLGNFEVNLYDNGTPATVANFLDYVQNGAYTDSVFHRSVPGFVIQGGGFRFDAISTLSAIPTNAAVTNEPIYSNVRGTIAMAKLGGDPNSATSQWYFNLSNNAASLDGQNGGFTAFGEVVGNGMDVVDAIAALPTFAFASPYGELPLQNYSTSDFTNEVTVDGTHLIIVTEIIVTDTAVNSAAGLNPVTNTANTGSGGNGNGGGGGGGSFGLFSLLGLLLLRNFRRVQ